MATALAEKDPKQQPASFQIALSEIKVGQRQREDVGNIEELAASLQEFGQLQPIILRRDNSLVAGFRRLAAHAMLGLTHIRAEYQDQLTDIQAKKIELEENVRRKMLDWKEESKAIEEIHRMQMAEDPNWTIDKTAATLGVSNRKVKMGLELSKAIDEHPEIARADTQQGAMMRLGQLRQIEDRKTEVQVRQLAEATGMTPKTRADILKWDARTDKLPFEDGSVDFLISNPPYGVDIEHLFIGDRKVYEDAAKDIVPMLREVTKEAFRVLKNDRWFVWFYPTARLEEGKDILAKAGFTLAQEIPCIWYKPNKYLSALSNPYQQFSGQYETFFFARKGQPKFIKLRTGNVFVYDTPDAAERVHPLQMPVDLWKEILEIGSSEGELVVEPFSGSGIGGVASLELARNYVGLENDQEYIARSTMLIGEARLKAPTTASAKFASVTQHAPVDLKAAFGSLNFTG